MEFIEITKPISIFLYLYISNSFCKLDLYMETSGRTCIVCEDEYKLIELYSKIRHKKNIPVSLLVFRKFLLVFLPLHLFGPSEFPRISIGNEFKKSVL